MEARKGYETARVMRELYGWAGVPFDARGGKQRALLQWWGDWRRSQDPLYWVERITEKILREQPEYAVVADVRLFREFGLCDFAIRVDPPGFEIADGAHHISELELDALPDSAWTAIIQAADPEEVEWAAVAAFRKMLASVTEYRGNRLSRSEQDGAEILPRSS